MDIKEFSESTKGFTKSPLGIIALFIVLVYGFASLVASFGKNLTGNIAPLIYFLVIFPVIVFFGFLWLVSKHHRKLYGPSDFQDEENFLKMQVSAVASLVAATAKQPNDTEGTPSELQIDEIIELVSKTTKKDAVKKWKNKILWVDDRPENNVYERQAFESQGIQFSLALSTDEAIENLKSNKYATIISDMGRKEGPKEGYILLEKLRDAGDKTPFFIYAGSNALEHKRMAKEKGAQGSTNRAQELFKMVMNAIENGS